jgi:polyphosphate kinase
MKNSKLITIIIILFVFTISGLSKAQENPTSTKKQYKCTPEEQAKKITDKMKTRLELTDEQYNKILKLQTDRITYQRELRSKDLISKSEVKQKRQEFRDGIKNTLTDEQLDKTKKMKKKHMKHRKNRW